jgi:hypothetical protein
MLTFLPKDDTNARVNNSSTVELQAEKLNQNVT